MSFQEEPLISLSLQTTRLMADYIVWRYAPRFFPDPKRGRLYESGAGRCMMTKPTT